MIKVYPVDEVTAKCDAMKAAAEIGYKMASRLRPGKRFFGYKRIAMRLYKDDLRQDAFILGYCQVLKGIDIYVDWDGVLISKIEAVTQKGGHTFEWSFEK